MRRCACIILHCQYCIEPVSNYVKNVGGQQHFLVVMGDVLLVCRIDIDWYHVENPVKWYHVCVLIFLLLQAQTLINVCHFREGVCVHILARVRLNSFQYCTQHLGLPEILGYAEQFSHIAHCFFVDEKARKHMTDIFMLGDSLENIHVQNRTQATHIILLYQIYF